MKINIAYMDPIWGLIHCQGPHLPPQPFELSYRIVGAQGIGKSDAYTTAVFDARFQRRVVVVHPELMDEALFKKYLSF